MAEAKVTAIIEAEDKASPVIGGLGGNFASLGIKMASIVGAAAAVYKGLQAVVESSQDAQVKIASMDATLKAAGDTTGKTRAAILDASSAFIKLGFDDEEAAKSMAILFQRTKDVKQAMDLTRLSADLARAKNMDLESSTKLVSMALSGQGRALMQYGISIKDSATPLEALGELQKAVGGQAEAFSKTFVGQGEVMKMTFDDLKQQLGDKILPILTKMLVAVNDFANALPETITQMKAFGAQILEVTGLGDVFAWLWDKVATAFNENLKPAIDNLMVALQPLAPVLKVIGQVLGAVVVGAIVLLADSVAFLTTTLVNLLAVATNVVSFFITSTVGAIKEVIEAVKTLVEWIKQAVEWLGKLSFSGAGSAIANTAKSVAGSISSSISSLLPKFDVGGIVPGPVGAPMAAIVHGGERIIPNGRGAGVGSISVTITGNSINSELDMRRLGDMVGRQIMDELRGMQMI